MKIALSFILWISFLAAFAQNDPLDIINKNTKPTVVYTTATFKSTRLISGHSIETLKKKHFDFLISHRFGPLNSGAIGFYGLDQATLRLGFEYGLTDRLMVGIGLSPSYSLQKTIDYFGKYKLLRQSSGLKNMPVSVTLFGSIAMITLNSSSSNSYSSPKFYDNVERLTYCMQLLIARKLSESVSLQISPTYLHRNKVFAIDPSSTTETLEPNDMLAIGIGGRIKISKRTSINAEYFYRLPSIDKNFSLNPNYHNSLSLGVDIETGGHVFQMHFTNSLGMIEKQFIGETTQSWSNGGVHYGFNISRTFSFDHKQKRSSNE